MKAFWWFREGAIAGMARPGFNSFRWFDLEFDEAVLLGWLGLHSSGSGSIDEFRDHARTYAPKIFRFHGLDEQELKHAIACFEEDDAIARVGERLKRRTGVLKTLSIDGKHLHFELNRERLDWEIEFLKSKGIGALVTLTERHHHRDVLADHFETHHLAIEDLGAPKREQVERLATIISENRERTRGLAVHCLAGIGRTSTMLMSAHLVLGESLDEMKSLIKRQNPLFVLTGAQSDFLHSFAR